tara:strand:+ start:598 stop:966 length:369 start_codon:yes stop_codon:yes gene_type:complete
MVYAEVGDNNEIFGAYSGVCGGLGMFHQNNDIGITVSDDPYEFDSEFGENVEEISSQIEALRFEFEEYDDLGDLVGLSSSGIDFVKNATEEEDGFLWAFSPDASNDFIYDIQDEWNLSFSIL